jgi:hypothetical protein
VEKEVPQTNEGTRRARPRDNVVRLGDWIEPREELVPFGKRRALPQLERLEDRTADPARPPERDPNPTSFIPEAPPSAEDFWGERSAAIHDAVQAPAEEREPDQVGGAGSGSARRRLRFAPTGRWRVAGALATLAAGGGALGLSGLGPDGSSSHSAGGEKLNVAAVLSTGVSRILEITSPPIAVFAGGDRARTRPRPLRRAVGPKPPSSSAHHAARRQPSRRPSPTYAPPATSTLSASTYHPSVSSDTSSAGSSTSNNASSSQASHSSPPPSPSRPTSSGATVSPTGASGALGPVQSPNG